MSVFWYNVVAYGVSNNDMQYARNGTHVCNGRRCQLGAVSRTAQRTAHNTHNTQHITGKQHARTATAKPHSNKNFLLGMGVDARQTSDVMHTRKKLRRPMSAWLHFSSPNGTGNSGCGFVAAWLNARVPKKLLHTGKKASHRVTEGCPHIGSGHNALLTAQHTNGVVLKRHLRNNDKGSEDDAVPHGATAASGRPAVNHTQTTTGIRRF